MKNMLKYFVLYSVKKKQHESLAKILHIAFSLRAATDETWVTKYGTERDYQHFYKLLLNKNSSIYERFENWIRTIKNEGITVTHNSVIKLRTCFGPGRPSSGLLEEYTNGDRVHIKHIDGTKYLFVTIGSVPDWHYIYIRLRAWIAQSV
jgi:hypothetical protein